MRIATHLLCALALWACSRPPAEAACRYRLVRCLAVESDATDPTGLLAREISQTKDLNVLVCVGDALTQAAISLGGRGLSVPLIAVDVAPALLESVKALERPYAALVSSAPREAAIELALLRCYGHPVPERMSFGPRLWTRNNQAAGGEEVPSPASFALAALRHQHAAVLAGPPPSDVVFRVGLVEASGRSSDDGQRRTDWARAAARHPQIHFDHRQVGGAAACVAALDHFRSENYNAILVDYDGHEIGPTCAEAVEQGIVVVKIGRESPPAASTLWLGTDAASFGRGLTQAILELLPEGGRLLAAESPEQRIDWEAVRSVLGSEFCR